MLKYFRFVSLLFFSKMLEAVCYAGMGQQNDIPEYEDKNKLTKIVPSKTVCAYVLYRKLQKAVEIFQMVGNSPLERDTIPGRKCAASAFMLQGYIRKFSK
tara:strand:- start:568 stop:867 length:300 start_codon:yes stop_codon:yes gene_type:complete